MIAVIDVGGNNLASLTNALTRLNLDFVLTHDKKQIQTAKQVILPGVGSASVAMQALRDHDLVSLLRELSQPLLGICVGMQLLFDHSEEGYVDGLGLIPGCVKKMSSSNGLPIPHMGWNQLRWLSDQNKQDYYYFVHSYAVAVNEYTLACCDYGDAFSAIVQKDTVTGMQFHPEKSSTAGLTLLRQFLTLESSC